MRTGLYLALVQLLLTVCVMVPGMGAFERARPVHMLIAGTALGALAFATLPQTGSLAAARSRVFSR